MIKNILLVLAIVLSATSVLAQNGNDRPLITVSGQAEIMVVPDEAVFNLRADRNGEPKKQGQCQCRAQTLEKYRIIELTHDLKNALWGGDSR